MCPMCLAVIGIYAAGAVPAVAGTTILATKLLRKRSAPTASVASTESTEASNRSSTAEGEKP